MKEFILVLFIWFIQLTPVSAQNDPKAIDILNKFSSDATSAPSVSMRFILIIDDRAENSTDTLDGSVIISKNSYRLDLPGNIIWYNGETSWSYLTAEKEVTVTKPDKKDDSFLSRPSSIFTMYKKGYKNRLVEEQPGSYLIDLYPEDIKNELIRVRLSLTKPSLTMKSFEYRRRDGVTITLLVKEYNLKQVPDAGTFIFSPEKYRGVEVIDMR